MTITPKTNDLQQIIGAIRVPTNSPPTHPGVMLQEEFLKPLGVSQKQLAEAIQVPYRQINEIINGQRPVTPSIALRLAKYIGMSTTFWINLQLSWDIYFVLESDQEILDEIQPLPRPDLPELMKLAGLEENDTP